MAKDNKIDEIIDDSSMIFGTTAVGITTAAKIARNSLEETKRYKVSGKISKLIKKLEK
ncbi:hypothetical protein ISS07_01470 [Candidatus Woesearchaeota archaeon]|nr:hypothetical protein [Candidatus Woesearchaeota archaeon]